MKTNRHLVATLAILATLAAVPAPAKESPLDFIHVLQKNGFPDVAVDYLNDLKNDPNAPKDVMDVWDLEMSKSKREAAKAAYNEAQAKQLNEEAQGLLDKFIKENPDRPEAIQAAAEWAAEKGIKAQQSLYLASQTKDAAEKTRLMAEARKTFEEIRPQFARAQQSSAKTLAALTPKDSRRKREDAVFQHGENRRFVATVDFYLAQTLEPGPERTAALAKVAKSFDGIYQDYRETAGFVGVQAHFWHARVLQEQGKHADARAIFEEVAANDPTEIPDPTAPPRPAKPTGYEEFFAEVEQSYLKSLWILSKADYFKEVRDWRKSHELHSKRCVFYQALTLDYAMNCLAFGEESKDETKKAAAKREALKVLGEMARTPSPFQQTAILKRRELDPDASKEDVFENALIDGNVALEKKNWEKAAELYKAAIDGANAKTEKARLDEVRNVYVFCVHSAAQVRFQNKKVDEALELVNGLLESGKFSDTKNAPAAAVWVLNVLYYQYLGAPTDSDDAKKAKADLAAKTVAAANRIISTWAAREEADSARIILMRLALEKSDLVAADKVFKEINPSSKEYPKALTVIGYQHFYKYRVARRALEKAESPDKDATAKLEEERKLALEYTKKAVDTLNVPRPEGTPMSRELREAMMLLAELHADGSDYKSAVEVYQPLSDDILKDSNTQTLDETTLRIFNGAVQSFLQLNDVEKATKIGMKLVELGPDEVPVNLAIMNFAKRLEIERKKVIPETGEATGEAAVRLKSFTDLQVKIMSELAKRDKLSAGAMVWIVKTCSMLGTDEADNAATDLVKKMFDRGNEDADFDSEIEKAKPGLRTLAATIDAKRGRYEEAATNVEQLIKAFPKALEPRMTRAHILTKWAAKDPAKYKDAISAWDSLRTKLENVKAKSGGKMNEFYEALYYEAFCFWKMAEKNGNKEQAKTGFDLILPYLKLDPKIQGPQRDRELSSRYFQLAGKLADLLGVPRPVPQTGKPKPSITPLPKDEAGK